MNGLRVVCCRGPIADIDGKMVRSIAIYLLWCRVDEVISVHADSAIAGGLADRVGQRLTMGIAAQHHALESFTGTERLLIESLVGGTHDHTVASFSGISGSGSSPLIEMPIIKQAGFIALEVLLPILGQGRASIRVPDLEVRYESGVVAGSVRLAAVADSHRVRHRDWIARCAG